MLSCARVRQKVLAEMEGKAISPSLVIPQQQKPWNFVFAACAGNVSIWQAMTKNVKELEDLESSSFFIDMPSFHFIGLKDHMKSESETISKMYQKETCSTIYLDSGHEIPLSVRSLKDLPIKAMEWYRKSEKPSSSSEETQIIAATIDVPSAKSRGKRQQATIAKTTSSNNSIWKRVKMLFSSCFGGGDLVTANQSLSTS